MFNLLKTVFRGSRTIATAVIGLGGLGGLIGTGAVDATDPAAQIAVLIVGVLIVVFQRLGARKEGKDVFDKVAEELKRMQGR